MSKLVKTKKFRKQDEEEEEEKKKQEEEDEEEKKKEEEEEKPEEEKGKKKKKEEDNSEEPDRLAALENKVDQLTSMVGKMLKKQENPEDPTDVDSDTAEEGDDNMGKKKQDEDEDMEKEDDEEEEKKKQEEEDEEEKKKADEGEPQLGEKEVKIPQASAGETDVDDKEEEDEVDILEKTIRKMAKKEVNRILKSKGITRSKVAPRPGHNITKGAQDKPVDMAADIIKKSKEGKINDIATTNRMIKKAGEKRLAHLQAEFDKEVI